MADERGDHSRGERRTAHLPTEGRDSPAALRGAGASPRRRGNPVGNAEQGAGAGDYGRGAGGTDGRGGRLGSLAGSSCLAGWLPSTLAKGEFGASGRDARRLSIPGEDRARGGGRRLQRSAGGFLRYSGSVRWYLTPGARVCVLGLPLFARGGVFLGSPGLTTDLLYLRQRGGGVLPWLAGERACKAAREKIWGCPAPQSAPAISRVDVCVCSDSSDDVICRYDLPSPHVRFVRSVKNPSLLIGTVGENFARISTIPACRNSDPHPSWTGLRFHPRTVSRASA